MQRHSTTSCFATYLLPHVLFVADRFLPAVNGIEEDSKAVLGILVAALDAAFLTRSEPR